MPATLQTRRLTLRQYDDSHIEQALEFINRNRTFCQPWSPLRDATYYTLAGQTAEMQRRIEANQHGRELRMFIFLRDQPDEIIGEAGFSNIVRGAFLSCHLGYMIDRRHARQGYMTEALETAIAHMFQKHKLHRIEANVMPRNAASIGVVEKLGFANEGLSRKYLKINGKWEDHLRFVLLNESLE